MKNIGLSLLLILSLCTSMSARAETYRMDLIVFLDKYGNNEAGRRPQRVGANRAIDLNDTAALASAGITLLPDNAFALNDEWLHLKNSKRFQPLVRIAWTQKDPPAEKGPALHLIWGDTFSGGDTDGFAPMEGSVSLLAGHYLHLDARLLYTQSFADGGRTSYSLKEKRLMRRDELHHLDSPKLGILAKVTRAGS
jgi:hypothetical protein